MNTLPWIAADAALVWLATFAFNTLAIEPLGFALVGLFLLGLVMTLLAIDADIKLIRGRGKNTDG